ncbi:MAG: metalloregulator ArsR/SmtB family transcription factor [Thermaerobacter sp.]|nr:metalloregulator ArsR/SmtB family transcription factor [Thermaerobacter sp.]
MYAAQFQALADPVRLQIVAVLHRRPRCVCEIQSAVGPIAANLLSYHLGILRSAGLVASQRRGRWLDYRLEYAAFEELRASLPQPRAQGVDDGPTCAVAPRRTTHCRAAQPAPSDAASR